MPSFRQVLEAVADTWATTRDEIVGQGRADPRACCADRPRCTVAWRRCRTELARARRSRASARQFDPRHGGFGGAPKFPQAPVLDFLLRAQHLVNDHDALRHGSDTLDEDGARRHLRPDRRRISPLCGRCEWLVPHFEKMLYDNAQLAPALPRCLPDHRTTRSTGASPSRRWTTCCAR